MGEHQTPVDRWQRCWDISALHLSQHFHMTIVTSLLLMSSRFLKEVPMETWNAIVMPIHCDATSSYNFLLVTSLSRITNKCVVAYAATNQVLKTWISAVRQETFSIVIKIGLCPNIPYKPLFIITWRKKKSFQATTSYLSSNRWDSFKLECCGCEGHRTGQSISGFQPGRKSSPYPAPLGNVFKKRSDTGF